MTHRSLLPGHHRVTEATIRVQRNTGLTRVIGHARIERLPVPVRDPVVRLSSCATGIECGHLRGTVRRALVSYTHLVSNRAARTGTDYGTDQQPGSNFERTLACGHRLALLTVRALVARPVATRGLEPRSTRTCGSHPLSTQPPGPKSGIMRALPIAQFLVRRLRTVAPLSSRGRRVLDRSPGVSGYLALDLSTFGTALPIMPFHRCDSTHE